jgi:predicted nucleotidyltransferase
VRRDAAVAILSRHRDELTREFQVASLALFGSVARDEAGPESDVDVLVRFAEPPGWDGYLALKWRLEELLGTPVDLVMDGALRPWARPIVESEAIRVA